MNEDLVKKIKKSIVDELTFCVDANIIIEDKYEEINRFNHGAYFYGTNNGNKFRIYVKLDVGGEEFILEDEEYICDRCGEYEYGNEMHDGICDYCYGDYEEDELEDYEEDMEYFGDDE